ncbi:MAG: hypothetical protein WAX44_01855 [Minisyncoccia bacterium]
MDEEREDEEKEDDFPGDIIGKTKPKKRSGSVSDLGPDDIDHQVVDAFTDEATEDPVIDEDDSLERLAEIEDEEDDANYNDDDYE